MIDWGDANIGDPAIDFVGLHLTHGREFTKQILARYQGEVDASFWKRVDFSLRYPPYSELLYGAYGGGETFTARGLAWLQEIFL